MMVHWALETNYLSLIYIFFYTGPDEKWSVSRVRRLEGLRPFDHASVERGGGGVTIASTRPFTMTTDSVKEVTPQEGASGDWEMAVSYTHLTLPTSSEV